MIHVKNAFHGGALSHPLDSRPPPGTRKQVGTRPQHNQKPMDPRASGWDCGHIPFLVVFGGSRYMNVSVPNASINEHLEAA